MHRYLVVLVSGDSIEVEASTYAVVNGALEFFTEYDLETVVFAAGQWQFFRRLGA